MPLISSRLSGRALTSGVGDADDVLEGEVNFVGEIHRLVEYFRRVGGHFVVSLFDFWVELFRGEL